jgi:hypothetical protein
MKNDAKNMLSKEMLNELREIIKEDFGESLDEKDLFEFGSSLLAYFELLAKIQAREENKSKMTKNLTFPSKSLK